MFNSFPCAVIGACALLIRYYGIHVCGSINCERKKKLTMPCICYELETLSATKKVCAMQHWYPTTMAAGKFIGGVFK